MTDTDLLAPSSDRRVINGGVLVAALRRQRATILALAIIGALAGALVSLAPASTSASTLVYLRFSDGTDVTQAMPTEVTVLTTRAVASGALHALGSNEDPTALLPNYRGTIASNDILRITAFGPTGATARRRADAVANAYLAYRAQLAQEQLDATVSALKAQQGVLRQQIAADDAQINSAASDNGGQGSTYSDLLGDRQQRVAQVQQIDGTIRNDLVEAQSVAQGSRVIDAARVKPVSKKKAIATNAVTGLLAGLVLGVGGVLFGAVVTTRLRRRADIAAALHAPVVLSLGPVVPRGWRRLVQSMPTAEHPNADLERLVGHLERTLTLMVADELERLVGSSERTLTLISTRALVVVSIDSLDVARLAVLTLADRLRDRGLTVSLVNETDEPLPDGGPQPVGVDGVDVVMVLAVLDPADGAEHLREWGSNAVAIVTTGRTTESKLAANATMLRSAGVALGSVLLVGSDPSDTTLGIVPREDPTPRAPAGAEARPRSVIESS